MSKSIICETSSSVLQLLCGCVVVWCGVFVVCFVVCGCVVWCVCGVLCGVWLCGMVCVWCVVWSGVVVGFAKISAKHLRVANSGDNIGLVLESTCCSVLGHFGQNAN